MTKYSYTTIESYFTKNTNSSVDKIKYLIYYFEAWTQTLLGKTFLTDELEFKVINNSLEMFLSEGIKEESKDEDLIFIINSVLKTYKGKSKNELEVLIKSEYPYIKARKVNKDNIIKIEDMIDYYSSISDIKVAKKLDK